MTFKKFQNLYDKMLKLTERHKILSEGHCKSAEPAMMICWNNDGSFSAEIYSYLMDLHDGGRHHFFDAPTIQELYEDIKEALENEERWLKEREDEKQDV